MGVLITTALLCHYSIQTGLSGMSSKEGDASTKGGRGTNFDFSAYSSDLKSVLGISQLQLKWLWPLILEKFLDGLPDWSSTMGGSFHGCFHGILRLWSSVACYKEHNLIALYPDSGFLRTLDSSIKRNTAVIKKLKQINEEQREGLMEDLRNVNLSKFVSEAVTSICDAKLRTSDIQVAVQICSLLHQRYKDFSPSLVQGLLNVFFPGKSGEDLDVDKNSKAMKKRSTLKLLLELYFVGVTEDSSIFINIIKDLTSTENLKDRDNTPTNLTLLASFARQGRVFLGLPPSGQETQEEFLKGHSITIDQKKVFRKAFHTYYDGVAELLQSEHASLH
ncbi:NONSENSE-MEDIATED MRNA DECAY PROTEIN 2 UP-FRAMESHIFT SUPPRESSOR 2 [Salix purpurea]|uniref:NONSENSE-MEDIATED MRNA DECAY PROTEIN 2 UP-FRAMESHIFT SUPPRESSOR 2 n=1 Tax=Salix purpurea TaxID=77065 RepID=A0A9Q0V205_SALPP|nr:NONSENSE-MEDIATED MRNA DECAY PROTEIN 2 UP-FRAMESHIFT SUPPRESSOR 2 [Salix purpurea]